MNEVDLTAFQFDYDLTWMAFFQNGKGQTYARYGGRNDRDSEAYMTQKSLASTMRNVLQWHKAGLVKTSSKYEPSPGPEKLTPEQLSEMPAMMAKRKESCIHCHDVKNAQLREKFKSGELSKAMIFTYPAPDRLGIFLNADDQTLIQKVAPESVAARAGLLAGDRLVSVDGFPVYTFADFSRVLELAPQEGNLKVLVRRDGKEVTGKVRLTSNWKTSPDPSWRASRAIVGPNTGFWANEISKGQRQRLKLSKNSLAMKVVVVWGGWARKAGVRNGDILLELDGVQDQRSMRRLQTHLQMNREFGDRVKLKLLRKGKEKELTMELPKSPPMD